MLKILFRRYHYGLFHNVIVNIISNDKIFKQQRLKKRHLTQLRVLVSINI